MKSPNHRNPIPVDNCKGCPYQKPFVTDGPIKIQPLVKDGSTFKDILKELKKINKQKRILEVTQEVVPRSSLLDQITAYGLRTPAKSIQTKVTFIIQEP